MDKMKDDISPPQGELAFSLWFAENYGRLTLLAKRYDADGTDVLNHVYLKIIASGRTEQILATNPWAYVQKAMWRECTMGQLAVQRRPLVTMAALEPSFDWSHREILDLALARLRKEDQDLVLAILAGRTIPAIAAETQVCKSTLYARQRRIKEQLINIIHETNT